MTKTSDLSEAMRQALLDTLKVGYNSRSRRDRTMIALENRGWVKRGTRPNPHRPVWSLDCWFPTDKAVMTQRAQQLAARFVKGDAANV